MAEYELKKSDGLFEDHLEETMQNDESEAASTFREMLNRINKASNALASEPVFENGIMFVPSCDCHIYAIDSKTGQIIWKFRTGEAIVHSPAVHNGTVYVGSNDNYLYALAAKDGRELWRFRTGDMVQSKPLIIQDKIIFCSFDRNVYALSLDGRELWKIRLPQMSLAELVYVNGMILIGAADGRLHAINYDGRELWSYYAGSTGAGTPVYVKETNSIAFVTLDGYLYNITMDGQFVWKHKCGDTAQTRYAYAIDNGVIYVGSGTIQNSAVYAIDLKRNSLLWTFPASGRVHATRFCNNSLICPSTDSNLYALDKDGRLLWKFQADGALNVPIAVNNGLIYQCSFGGHIYCLTENGELIWKLYFPGQAADIKRVLSPVQNLAEKIRSAARFWRPEKSPNKEYETKSEPQLTLGPAAYKMSEPYKSEMKYSMSGPAGYQMGEKKKDWRDQLSGKR